MSGSPHSAAAAAGRHPASAAVSSDGRGACHDPSVPKKWCLGCNEWVEPIKRRIGLGREGGTGKERPPSQTVEFCPNDDGTAFGHLLVDAPPK